MIVIPTYNESENIEALVRGIRTYLPNEQILFVDDNSPDRTAEKIKAIQQSDTKITLISRDKKLGLGSAYIRAFTEIKKNFAADLPNAEQTLALQQPEYIVTMDADLSHDPKYIPEMLNALKEGADFVIGSRYVSKGNTASWSFYRSMLSKLGNLYTYLLTGLPISDITSGFMAFKKELLHELPLDKIRSEGFAFQIDFKNQVYKLGRKITELPILFANRASGESKLSLAVFLEGFFFPLKVLAKRLTGKQALWPWLIFVITFAAYFFSAPRTIFFGDNAEFITAVKTLGIAHPPGYPLYIILAKAFSLLPLGSFVFRVNIFSAFCASIGLVFAYWISVAIINLLEIFKPRFGENIFRAFAALAVILFGFTGQFWYQDVTAKPYALNFLIVAVLLHLFFKFWRIKKEKYLSISAFVFGLGLANHQSIALLFPALAFGYFLIGARLSLKQLGKIIFWTALPLLFYLYLPLRSAFHPALDWGHTAAGPANFFYHITRQTYHDFARTFILSDKIEFAAAFFTGLFGQLKWLLVLSFLGLVCLTKESKKYLAVTLLLVISNVGGIIFLRSVPFSAEAAEFYQQYYLPAYLFVFLLAVPGTLFALSFFDRKAAGYFVVVLTLAGAGLFFRNNFASNNFRNFNFIDKFSSSALASLEPGSVLLFSVNDSSEDTMLFSLAYQKYAAKMRPDIAVVSYVDVFPQIDNKAVDNIYLIGSIAKQRELLLDYALEKYPGKPVYTTYFWERGHYSFISTGFFYRIIDLNNNATDLFGGSLDIPAADLETMQNNFFGRDFLKNYYYAQAAREIYHKRFESSQAYFIKAIQIDNAVDTEQQKEYMAYRSRLNKE